MTKPHADLTVVTPELAREFLANEHPFNRRLKVARLNDLMKEEKAGFFYGHDTYLKFDTDGRLCNGKHTCQMIIQTGKPQEVFVVKNLDPRKALCYSDTAASRSMQDRYLAKWGELLGTHTLKVFRFLDVNFQSGKVADDISEEIDGLYGTAKKFNHPEQLLNRKIHEEWRPVIDLFWSNGQTEQGKPPTWFNRPNPEPLVTAAALYALRAHPDQAKVINRWVWIATFGSTRGRNPSPMTDLEQMTAERWYCTQHQRCCGDNSSKLRYFRECTKNLYRFFEHKGHEKVMSAPSNPFAKHFKI